MATKIKRLREAPKVTQIVVTTETPHGMKTDHTFSDHVQATIFCTCLWNGFYEFHSDRVVKKFISCVEDVYYKDENIPSDVVSICDYMAEHWEEIEAHEKKGDYNRRLILCHYYASII